VNPTGPEGEISLRSGMELITGGLTAWAVSAATL
jgi:hypothetical protein